MKKFLLVSMLIMLCASSSNVIASEKNPSTRLEALKHVKALKSGYTMDKLKALTYFAEVSNPEQLTEFDVITEVKEIISNREKENHIVRRQALSTIIAWNKNGISVPGLLDLLNSLVVPNSYETPPIRITVYKIIVDISQDNTETGPNPYIDRAFNILTDLWKDKKIFLPGAKKPTTMSGTEQAALLHAIGAFGSKPKALDILLTVIDKTSDPVLTAAALAGMRNIFQTTTEVDSKLADKLGSSFMKAKTSEIKLLFLECLELVVSTINATAPSDDKSYKLSPKTRTAIIDMLKKGDDQQVVAAVKMLMSISRNDPSVTTDLLSVASPSTTRPLTFSTLNEINMALVDVLISITSGTSIKAKNVKDAEAIINHMLKVLNPALADKTPLELRRTMVLGLSALPVTMDRTRAVESLIALLSLEQNKDKVSAFTEYVEEALTYLTGQTPFRTKTSKAVTEGGDLEIEVSSKPDVKAWEEWFTKNKSKLAKGQSPF